MKKAFATATRMAGKGAMILGAGGLLLGACIVLSLLPDVKRYVRISTM